MLRKIWDGFYNKYLNIMEDKDIRNIIDDINKEIELTTAYIDSIISKSAKWYLDMHVNFLTKVVNDLERLL